jgi:hypothetical protein
MARAKKAVAEKTPETAPAKAVKGKQTAVAPVPAKTKAEALPISKDAFECREKIKMAAANVGNSYYELCEQLHAADLNRYWAEWGFDSFEAYADKELDIGYRKARYLASMYDAFLKANITRDQVVHIGWSKVKEICPLITADPKSAKKWLKEAEKKGIRELAETIRVSKGAPARPDVVRLSLKFEPADGKIVTDALVTAFGEIGEEKADKGIAHICGEWIMTKGAGSPATTLDDWVTYLEKLFGVTLTVEEGAETSELAEGDSLEESDVNALLGVQD